MKSNKKNLILDRYNPSLDTGLNDLQVNERIKNGLFNETNQKYSKSYLNILINNICTVFNLLGLIVFVAMLTTGSAAKLSDYFFVIFYIVNISIGIIQEIRAKKCIDKLSLIGNKKIKAIRNSEIVEISSNKIVLDDIIFLGIGNQVPTDCKIVEGEVEVNEALLTGESVPVKKNVGDELLAGSFIVSGTCKVQAVKIGKDNYVETLSAKAKKYKKPQSEIMNSLKLIIKIISFIIVPIAVAWMLKSMVILKAEYSNAVLGTATVVIGMIPAGMFLLTSVALAVGIIKLAKHNTLVQDLYSLEMLARVDTICFDKTGTITDGRMSVKEIVCLNDCTKYDVNRVMSSMLFALKDNNQTAIALAEHFGQNEIFNTKVILPFNSSRKLSAVTFSDVGTYAFGAPEFVLAKSNYQKIKHLVDEYAKLGLRVLVLARSDNEIVDDNLPNDFSQEYLFIIEDNIRKDATVTIEWFKQNGVAIKVISGDNPVTVSEVSKRVGIDNAEKFISLEGLTDEEVYKIANEYTVFGRVTPEQKAILIKALKNAGHVTAMTGDGVNDILAMKEADCAVSVAAGSEAARNVSHLVLLDNNFNSMPQIVYEGRRVINNVQSSASLFLMKTFFTMLMGILTLFLPYMETYPYRLNNMIMFEVFIIGIPSFFLSFQPNDKRVEGRFINYVIKKSIPSAILMIISVLIIEIFRLTLHIFPDEIYTTMSVYALTFAGVINLYLTCKPLNKFRSAVFFGNLVIILIISFLSLNGLLTSLISLSPLIPLEDYWHHILIVVAVILLDIPLSMILQKIFSRIDFVSKNQRS